MPPEQVEREEAAEEKKPRRSKLFRKKKFLLPAVILLAVVLAGALFVTVTERGGELLRGFTGEEEAAEESSGPDYKFEVPEIVINLTDEQQGRFLSLKFYLGFNEPALNEEIEDRMPEIRDAVLDILWDREINDGKIQEEREVLRERILTSSNEILTAGEVKEVYFWHFLIQH